MNISTPRINTDAAGRTRSSTLTTLFDGKTLSADEDLIWENVGTGTSPFNNNAVTLNVTAGQYMIRRGNRVTPYFSGKSHLVEQTFDTFGAEVGTTKRVGYFSSNAVAPYDSNKDGFWLENDTTNGVVIKISKDGVETASIPLANWDNADLFAGYDWDNFTVIIWDFLWLGGTELRLFIKTPEGFVLAHTYKHAGTTPDIFIKTPNHSVRYELRSSTGTGSFETICSQIATEGGFPEAGKPLVIYNPSSIPANSVGTIYALKGVKKLASFRDIAITVTRASIANGSTNDIGIGMLLLNPTLSAPLTYATNSRLEEGTATNQTVTDVGRILATFPSGNAGTVTGANDSILASIPMDIQDVSGEIILAYMPTTTNQSVFGTISTKVY